MGRPHTAWVKGSYSRVGDEDEWVWRESPSGVLKEPLAPSGRVALTESSLASLIGPRSRAPGSSLQVSLGSTAQAWDTRGRTCS